MSVRRRLWTVGAAGALLGVGVAALAAASESVAQPAGIIVPGLLIGWSFIGTGLLAWRRRPANRVGALMVAVGFAWFVAGLISSDVPLLFSIGYVASAIPFALVVHLLLAYPTGRLETRVGRWGMRAAYVDVTLGPVLVALFERHIKGFDHQPRNLFLVADRPALADALQAAWMLIGVLLLLVAGALLLSRWRAATAVQRRNLAPVMWTGAMFLAFLAISLSAQTITSSSTSTFGNVAGAVASICFLAVPWAYLFGLLRAGWSRAHAVGALVRRLSHAETRQSVRDAMAEALGDPDLDLVFKRRDRDEWVDARGRRYVPPPGRTLTEIVREGEAVGAIVRRPALDDEPELLRSVGAAAALALDNERLQAELRARVAELQDSRANIVAFGMAERRRLERDLHDGAQQRLVALSLQVNLARAKLEDDPATAAALLDRARDELRQALDELRELARGIHPAILTEQGLAPALAALAERLPVPVDVDPLPVRRLPAPVEAVAYFVVAESLTNVAKYAHAGRATVSVARDDGSVLVEVRDDGVGGADLGSGTGLRGLADRVGALDGRLEILSNPGEGTLVRAAIPCASS